MTVQNANGLLAANAIWLSKGMHPDDIGITPESYLIPIGITELSPANAPFLNWIRVVPFVVPPSGYIIKGHSNPFSHSICLSEIYTKISFFWSLFVLSTKMLPTAFAMVPTPGNLPTLALATFAGGYLDMVIGVSAHDEWFPTIDPGFSYDGFQSGPKYFL